MHYKALKNLTQDGELIAVHTEDLTEEQLGGPDAVQRLVTLGAIEKMTSGTKAKAAEKAETTNAPVKVAEAKTIEKEK
jgi:hypothetical protein